MIFPDKDLAQTNIGVTNTSWKQEQLPVGQSCRPARVTHKVELVSFVCYKALNLMAEKAVRLYVIVYSSIQDL